jgi:hypothetical protein
MDRVEHAERRRRRLAVMSMAKQRFDDLRQKFRAAVPGRNLTFEQHRALSLAASLQQISEVTLAAQIMSGQHDRGLIEQLQTEARYLIAAATARPNQKEKKR